MPHSSSTIFLTNATKRTSSFISYSLSSPPPSFCLTENKHSDTRYPVPTPPLSMTSPVELAPILDDNSNNHDNKRPPSPDSPRINIKFNHSSSVHLKRPLPDFLEPKLEIVHPVMFPLDLFNNITSRSNSTITTIPLFKKIPLQIPIPRRSNVNNIPVAQAKKAKNTTVASSLLMLSNTTSSTKFTTPPMSPTMTAASASASVSASAPIVVNNNKSRAKPVAATDAAITPITLPDVEDVNSLTNKNNVDQSMFLTKTDHIKRPRNAWIHFRCHYGQALKAQDPTLRAEEISKRASRRWAKLSENEKKPWHGLAEQEKLAHREAFPEYRYCPRRATTISSTTSHSSTSSNSSIVTISEGNHNRPRSASAADNNTPLLHAYDVYSNAHSIKRVKRNPNM